MSLAKKKEALRKSIKRQLETYRAEDLFGYSIDALSNLEKEPAFRQAKTILLYWSMPDEVNTHAFIEKWCENKTILLPVIIQNRMEASLFEGKEKMNAGPFDLLQPNASTFKGTIDLVVVPGRAFDIKGHRLGRGKGFYDKFLKEFSGTKIGVCFKFQLQNDIPFETFDVVMDKVISD